MVPRRSQTHPPNWSSGPRQEQSSRGDGRLRSEPHLRSGQVPAESVVGATGATATTAATGATATTATTELLALEGLSEATGLEEATRVWKAFSATVGKEVGDYGQPSLAAPILP